MSDKYWAIVPAAGVGARMMADRPKQYLSLANRAVIEHTLDRLAGCEVFEQILVVLADQDPYWPQLSWASNPMVKRVAGGRERAYSVFNALQALAKVAKADDWVLVHDAARSCVGVDDILRLISRLKDSNCGGLLGLPVSDTLKQVGAKQEVLKTHDRRQFWLAQTPQMFRFDTLYRALEKAFSDGFLVTDEASAIEHLGLSPQMVEGSRDNIKITRPEDLRIAEAILSPQ